MAEQKKKPDHEGLIWVLIVFLFAVGLSPLAVLLLFWNLFHDDVAARKKKGSTAAAAGSAPRTATQTTNKTTKKTSKKAGIRKNNGKALKIWGVILLAIGVLACVDPVGALVNGAGFYVLADLLYALAFAVGGGAMLGKGVSLERAQQRYSKYLTVLGDREAMSLGEMSRITGCSRKRISRDLEDMIDKGYFGGKAYLHMEEGWFYRSQQAAEDLRRKAAAEAAAKSVPKEAEEGYSGILRNIRRANDRIADPMLSEKIDRLEIVTAAIFRAVEDDPTKQPQIATFLNYYLPTTQKLLDSYAEFEAAGVEGENLRQAKQRIEATMDSIIKGFEHQLDALYHSDALDIDSDIRVMETMLRRDRSSVEEDFGLGGAAVQQEEL